MHRRHLLRTLLAAAAAPSFGAFAPAALADSCPTDSQSGFPWGMVQGIATNLAFALEGGPVIAAGLAGIFGGLMPGEAATIKNLLAGAVCQLESYLNDLHLAQVESDAASFFGWAKIRMGIYAKDGDWSEAAISDATDVLSYLEPTQGFAEGTLFNVLNTTAADIYIKQNTWTSPDQDSALSALVLLATALIAATKLRIQIHWQLVAHYMPDPRTGRCTKIDDDNALQAHIGGAMTALAELTQYLDGTDGYPAAFSNFQPFFDFKQLGSASWNYHAWLQAPMWSALAAQLPPPIMDELVKVFGELRAYQGGLLGGARWGDGQPTPQTEFKNGEYGGGATDVGSYAGVHGWPAAVDRMIMHRWASRLLLVDNVGSFDEVELSCGANKNQKCEKVDNAGYRFTDNGTGKTYKLYNSAMSGAHTEIWDLHTGTMEAIVAQLTGYDAASQKVSTPTFVTTQSWRDALAAIRKLMPPDPPVNTATVADGAWKTDPPAGSVWRKADEVSYAVSWTNDNGPSARSAFTSDMDLKGGDGARRWGPTLRHLPVDPNTKNRLQVWRQFDGGSATETDLIPQIVATLDPGQSEYTDVDNALVAAA